MGSESSGDISTRHHICRRCGYSWEARVPNPKECPNCKARLKQVVREVGKPEKDRADI